MTPDLDDLLHGAENAIAGSAAPMDAHAMSALRAAVGRRRARRHAVESLGLGGALAAVGAVAWLGLGPDPVLPVVGPGPSASRTLEPPPEPTATPTPTPAVTAPPERSADVDDATVLERLTTPRTGETWLPPSLVADPPVLVAGPLAEEVLTFLVGRRGEAEIYAVVAERRLLWDVGVNLFEVGADGARLIACPSSRPDDPCTQDIAIIATDVARDTATFYDTLTLPRSIALTADYTVTTASTGGPVASGSDVYGDGGPLLGEAAPVQVLRDLGPLQVVQETLPSEVPGLSNVSIDLRTPFGSLIRLDALDLPAGDFGAITWDDGVERGDEEGWAPPLVSLAPGALTCSGLVFSVQDGHAANDWRAAGTAPDGHRVFVPVAGGTPLSRAVRSWHESASFSYGDDFEPVYGVAAGYPFLTDEEFEDANALYAIQGPTGQWLLGLRADASNVAYECS